MFYPYIFLTISPSSYGENVVEVRRGGFLADHGGWHFLVYEWDVVSPFFGDQHPDDVLLVHQFKDAFTVGTCRYSQVVWDAGPVKHIGQLLGVLPIEAHDAVRL